MEITFDEEKHQYWIDGIEAISVTQLLKSAGISPDLARYYTKEAQNRGTAVHLATELIDKGVQDLDDYLDSPYLPYIQGWVEFVRDSKFNPIEIEKRVGNQAWLVAGTFDRFGTIGQEEWMLDLKTGSKMRHHGVQLAGYNFLRDGSRSRRRATVQLLSAPKKGKLYTVERYDDPTDYDAFIGAAALVAWKRLNS